MYLPPPTEGGNFTPPPAGTHLAVCYRVIDLGTQKQTFQGETKMQHKVLVSWEIPDEKMEDGRPFTISKRYTWSMHEKSTLRKDLEAWRGAAFQANDFGPNGFDIRNVLGKACILSIVHKENDDGKVFANIASIGKTMKGMAIPQAENTPVYLWIHPSRWEEDVFESLSDGLKNAITSSPEYQELRKVQRGEVTKQMNGNGGHVDAELNDDIPF